MSQAYANFLAALDEKSPETKRTYEESFRMFLTYNETKNPDKLIEPEAKELQQKIRSFMAELKQKGLSYSTINKAYWAIRMFYATNEVLINWDWVNLYKPKKEEKEQEDRPYTKEEVMRCLMEADERTKAAILVMSTAGPRVGGLPTIRIKDLEFIEKYDLYCLTIYPFDQDARYRTFVTPQATLFIDEYKGKRKDKDPLFVNKRDSDLPITKGAIEQDIWDLLKAVRLRVVDGQRKEVQMDHGFRKFATTTWRSCGLEKESREALDGQNPGIQKRYAKLPSLELLEISKYSLAIPTLTF